MPDQPQPANRAAIAKGDTWMRDTISPDYYHDRDYNDSDDRDYNDSDDPNRSSAMYLRAIALSLADIADLLRADKVDVDEQRVRADMLGVRI